MRYFTNEERCELLAAYVIETGATVRATANRFGISKSTVHKDLSYKLRKINPTMYKRVELVLQTNKSERHIRGGEATRKKYLDKRCEVNKNIVQWLPYFLKNLRHISALFYVRFLIFWVRFKIIKIVWNEQSYISCIIIKDNL